jgi:hypothetical protein
MIRSAFSFEQRSLDVAGPLAPLAASLAADLDRLLPDEDFLIPAEKARMTRIGGRCERDGSFLEFDPLSPRRHRCPVCGAVFDAEEHYRWWIMGYQLWLSERAVHAAALGRLTGGRYTRLAEAIVRRLGDEYTNWPNADNVLGPSRVFFSTYLESIWLLQLSFAVSILEAGTSAQVGGDFRDRIAQPCSTLVAEFNEGLSNRQVWNSAALGAAGFLLSRPALVDRSLHGPGGLLQFLDSGLLSDGSWYEGENYHLFAHRGLWYLVRIADIAGAALPDESLRRFDAGFVAPLRTALPDFTFPARRDSQYRASLRQWRLAESLELGLARRTDSSELAAGLAMLYRSGPDGDAARWRSTGEAERNVPGVRLSRADLGWKSLLFAQPDLPSGTPVAPGSALMDGQGFAVVRRNAGRTYVALDYGHTGGSHGHPDRLNLWLVLGDERVFEDVGTGSYVEKTLHWYRSTLAHNAPLVNGKSQDPVAGSLRAWDEHGEFAWADAEARIAQGVLVRRSVVVGPGHIVDRVEWESDRDVTFDLPFHIEGDPVNYDWKPAVLTGGTGLEDGFEFVRDAEMNPATVELIESDAVIGAIHCQPDPVQSNPAPNELWRAVAPGPPGGGPRSFYLVRMRGRSGRLLSVWSWDRSLWSMNRSFSVDRPDDDSIQYRIEGSQTTYRFHGDVCRVQSAAGEFTLDGRRQVPFERVTGSIKRQQQFSRQFLEVPLLQRAVPSVGELSSAGQGLRFELGEANYRRTESAWASAGSIKASVVIAATRDELLIEVDVRKRDPYFAERRAENPLDNEHPDVNSDGIQIHLAFLHDAGTPRYATWLLVPGASDSVRVTARDDAASVPLSASWKKQADRWLILSRIQRASLGPPDATFSLDVIVNEMPAERERRRGQLVLSAKSPGWAYLRGDRHEIDQLIPMVVRDG